MISLGSQVVQNSFPDFYETPRNSEEANDTAFSVIADHGHYPSSRLCLKCHPVYISKQRFGDWILSPSSGKTYVVGSSELVPISGHLCHF
jgi:hypothetical protein